VDVEHYLQDYAANKVDPSCFRFGCTVTQVKQCSSSNDNDNDEQNVLWGDHGGFRQPFQVEWNDMHGLSQTQAFDGMIVATGFFSVPFVPEYLQMISHHGIMHSSQYRSPTEFANQTVAVVGSSFSALEIAADVRRQASQVIRILPRVPYVLARYVPSRTGNAFVPWMSSCTNDDNNDHRMLLPQQCPMQ
jgi:lysine/ornithine N-monooxygenase